MLQIKDGKVVDKKGQEIFLRGIALGGWLMMEGYMLGGKNIFETKFRERLAHEAGEELAEEFKWEFRKRFFTEKDADRVRKLGFNCVRLPFNHKAIEAAPFKLDVRGMDLLKQAVGWFAKRKIYVILDVHAVPGSQNEDWHSDSDGRALFYKDEEYRKRYVWLWGELAKIFKNEKYVAAYDIMNEPVVQDYDKELDLLKKAYVDVIKAVRDNGDQHIIFLEGHTWAQRPEFIAKVLKDNQNNNVALSIHFYEPAEFSFNDDPTLSYPGVINGVKCNRETIRAKLAEYQKYGVPVYVGEFGAASRMAEQRGAYRWVEDVKTVLNQLGYHWTYWTYKSVAGMPFPDGLYQFFEPKDIFAKDTDHPGMQNVVQQLKSDKKRFYEYLDTKKFRLNERLASLLGERDNFIRFKI